MKGALLWQFVLIACQIQKSCSINLRLGKVLQGLTSTLADPPKDLKKL